VQIAVDDHGIWWRVMVTVDWDRQPGYSSAWIFRRIFQPALATMRRRLLRGAALGSHASRVFTDRSIAALLLRCLR
jgi:hypothetical protein